MLTIGDDELGDRVNAGDYVVKGSLKGPLVYGTVEGDSTDCLLGFVKIGDVSYVAAIRGQLVGGWELL